MKKKWFHAVGGCGKTTANVAKMFKDMGWFVTASDLQCKPPAKNILVDNEIPFVEGYHFSHLTREFWTDIGLDTNNVPDMPDLGLIIETATGKNKELRFARLHNIDIRPYSQVLNEYLIKDESIVVIGTAGKTTTTTLLTLTLQALGLDPSYMIGAEVNGLSDSLKNTDSDWSVIEGDEYHSLELSNGAKFLEYKPKYLIITNIGWEHQDVFPTREKYIEEFRKAVKLVPEDGVIVAKSGDDSINEIVKDAKCTVARYGLDNGDYIVNGSRDSYELMHDDRTIASGSTTLLGSYNLENVTAVLTLVNILIDKGLLGGDALEKATSVIKKFRGVKKRLEILFASDETVVIDDFGVAPHRSKRSLETVQEQYPDKKIIALFEPNSGSRVTDASVFNELYVGAFGAADEVWIPPLSEFNKELISQGDLASRLGSLGVYAKAVSMDELNEVDKDDLQNSVLVVFSTYNLGESINTLVGRLSK